MTESVSSYSRSIAYGDYNSDALCWNVDPETVYLRSIIKDRRQHEQEERHRQKLDYEEQNRHQYCLPNNHPSHQQYPPTSREAKRNVNDAVTVSRGSIISAPNLFGLAERDDEGDTIGGIEPEQDEYGRRIPVDEEMVPQDEDEADDMHYVTHRNDELWNGKYSPLIDKIKFGINGLVHTTKSALTPSKLQTKQLFEDENNNADNSNGLIPDKLFASSGNSSFKATTTTNGNCCRNNNDNDINNILLSKTSQLTESKCSWFSLFACLFLSLAFFSLVFVHHNKEMRYQQLDMNGLSIAESDNGANNPYILNRSDGYDGKDVNDGNVPADNHGTNSDFDAPLSKQEIQYDEYFISVESNLSPMEAPIVYYNGPTVLTVRVRPPTNANFHNIGGDN